ncbi:MAG: beta-ketoacyl-ACP synthase II [Bacteroidetes bacterium]|uniref:3-oxoacyl-[acyl-carrier-protein] synthase 2 n=1 Tax=Candidatus Cryptobacteroides gallistercoris TaxID=2840765 RepID=A0A940DPF2_9BACT|nr:beta-ketoacyl-ACP synthase II [Candidatus Cryptobacteroides gallistercoris]
MDKRVVITGMGAITPVGNSVAELWDSLVNGVCGVGLITEFPTDDLPAKVAGEVKNFNPADYGIEPAFARKQDKFSVFAVAAASEAIKQSGLVASDGEDGNIDPMRFGVYVGSGIGGFSTQYMESEKMIKDGPKWISPLFIPTMIANMAAGNIAIRYNLCGPCIPVVTACATSTHTVGEAYRAIRHGYADAIIAGGSEAATIPLGIAGFANAKALSRSEDPNYASLPFNANRGGFVMGEGAAMLVLEEYEHAKARGAKIIAEICGYGNTCDAYHMTAPRTDCKTQAAAVKMALDEAGYNPSDVLHINAHGTGTSLNDSLETKTFKLALGDDAYKAHICSTKSMTGHMLGATGAVEAIAAVLALTTGIVPPTIHLDAPDPECDLNYTPNKAVKADITLAISDSLGFGGHNGCVAFRKVE